MLPAARVRRLPCSRAELEALRSVMFACFRAGARDPNVIRGFLLTAYAVELAPLLAGPTGLQRRLSAWHRWTRPCRVGYPARRRSRRGKPHSRPARAVRKES